MRALIITWIATLGVIALVAIWLELSYEPAASPPASPPATGGPTKSPSAAGDLDRELDVKAKSEPETIEPAPPAILEPEVEPQPGSDRTPREPEASAPQSPTEVPQKSVSPMAELSEPGPHGPLPVARENRRPWKVYGLEFALPAETPLIAIVLTHFGLGTSASEGTIAALPQEVTFAVSPYGRNLEASVEALRRKGHEVTLMMPMEPRSYPAANPGPHTLLVNGAHEENIDRLHYVLSRLDGYVGLVVEMGSRFTADYEAVRPIMADLSRRGLLFLDTSPRRTSRARELAAEFGVPNDQSDLFIDNDPVPERIAAYLSDLELIARREGTAVGIGRVTYAETVEQISVWAASLAEKEVALAPLSAVMMRQEATR